MAPAGVALVLALSACSPEEAVHRPPEPVEIITAALSDIRATTALTGEIVARNEANYAFETGGRVVEVLVDVGAKVAAGKVLARLDPTGQEADVAAAEAALSSAEAQARQAASAFERQKELLAKGYTTRGNFDDAEKALSAATSAVDIARADLATARTNLEDTALKADADGVITSRSVDPGQVVSAAQTAFGFAENGRRDAVFDIQEQLLIAAEAPPKIAITLVGDPGVKTIGHVREISPLIDPRTGTVRVKVALETVPPEMTLGTTVVGRQIDEEGEQAIVLPWDALMALGGKPAVWVVEAESGAAELRPIEVGAYQSGAIVVAAGIAPGERVVAAGSQLVRPGQIVDPAKRNGEGGA